MAARDARHQFLARVARAHQISTILLAHHADDQVELFFLRLLRGAGPDGLAGMRVVSNSPADRRLRLLRPWLDLPREALAAYAMSNGVRFREDASNSSHLFLRNRIRNELLPLLKKDYQPSLQSTVLRSMELLRSDSEFLDELAAAFDRSPHQPFETRPVALQRRWLRGQLWKLGIAPEFDDVEKLRGREWVTLDAGRRVRRNGYQLEQANPMPAARAQVPVSVDLRVDRGAVEFAATTFRWRRFAPKGEPWCQPGRAGSIEYMDADAVGSAVILRQWIAGDRFRPLGMTRAVKLQDLFVNRKVPRDERHRRVVMVHASGELIWVQGLPPAERCKMEPRSRMCLSWEWQVAPAKAK
jgi:tRNA(Ile)-lysidine synthase